jgi:uncharacterized Zn-finger protein
MSCRFVENALAKVTTLRLTFAHTPEKSRSVRAVLSSLESPTRIYSFLECTLCEKSFNQKNNLTTHLRTHSEYHPSNCSICNQTFSSFNELFNHMKEHSQNEQKPNVCNVCNKVVPGDLGEHMKAHSNKPYKCDVS